MTVTTPHGTRSVVIASQLDPAVNELLRAHPSQPRVVAIPDERPWEAAKEADAEVLLVRPAPAWRYHGYAAAPAGWPGRVRWVFSGTTGVDFYPRWLVGGGTPLTCARGVASGEIAEYVIAAILAQTKNLDTIRVRSRADWKPTTLGRLLESTVGIVGLGSIGSAVAVRALALGARVIAVRNRRIPSPVRGVELLDSVVDLVERADHIVLALPATEDTYALFDGKLLSSVKEGAHLVNVARGTVIDQTALMNTLEEGPLAYATLDVTEPEPLPEGHPLYSHEQVRLTPHVASLHPHLHRTLYEKIAENLDRYLRGEPLVDQVDPSLGY
ncbi:MAG: NAD(P)-dependent oxidoreductase [Polyangiales bacterium]